MRVILLSDIDSEHTEKWALGLASKGIEVGIFSMNRTSSDWFIKQPGIQVLFQSDKAISGSKFSEKAGYVFYSKKLKLAIAEFKPDLIHAHYATSYGLLGALSGFHPFILSVWGADVFDFPRKNFLTRSLFKFNLGKADKVLSTSYVMRKEILKYFSGEVEVTPFGVDLSRFYKNADKGFFSPSDFVFGTIKSLEPKYGIEILIRAFAKLYSKNPESSFKLLIVGSGSMESKLKDLSVELQINHNVVFTGRIPNTDVPKYNNMMDVFVSPSVDDSESFGVSAVEASACELPVIASDVGGLPEVIQNGVSGIIVPPADVDALVAAMETLFRNAGMREAFGKAGREFVLKNFDWNQNLQFMIDKYKEVVHVS